MIGTDWNWTPTPATGSTHVPGWTEAPHCAAGPAWLRADGAGAAFGGRSAALSVRFGRDWGDACSWFLGEAALGSQLPARGSSQARTSSATSH